MMSEQVLERENQAFLGTGGRSQDNQSHGFHPAFLDTETRSVYAACFADGSPAAFHVLDGLPPEVVISRSECGRVKAVKPSVISGFVRNGRFYTREAAARLAAQRN